MRRIDTRTFGPWAVVTGASSGIGKEFARQLAANGLHLVLVARRRPLLETLGAELASTFGIRYRTVGVDLRDDNFLTAVTDATDDLDVGLLISNAGDVRFGEFLSLDQQSLSQGVSLNVLSHLRLAQHFGNVMARRGRGGMLLVSSTVATHGAPFMADYAAAKAYLLVLGEALHLEFQQRGLHMTVLLPGPTATEGVAASGLDMPMKPMSVEQCVAEGIKALSANRATYIAGRRNRIMTALIPGSAMRKMMGTVMAKALAARRPQTIPVG
ncbi:MAG TPA: SDR family NAD(P)-dependent oxidoreductase [Ktedonobacterales bacterium]|nr:SDR family NAD(P)-dependent oxidoreductase [Ktedonobacterales bacterium]